MTAEMVLISDIIITFDIVNYCAFVSTIVMTTINKASF